MKIENDLVVEIEDARFIFESPSYKDALALGTKSNDGPGGQTGHYLRAMVCKLRRVENLLNADDQPIEAERVRELDIDLATLLKIFGKWSEAISAKFGVEPEADEKKVVTDS